MALRTITVCDRCGKPASVQIRYTVKGKPGTKIKDLCNDHLKEIESGSRVAKVGRPRNGDSTPTPKRRKTTRRKKVAK